MTGAGQAFGGKVVLVTGAASGIGEACAAAFAARGARVAVADVDLAAEQAAGALGQKGGTAAAVQADVADPASVEAMVRFATETYGGLDVAVNNAGIGGAQAPTGEYPLDSWQKVIDVNLTGVFYCLRYQIPAPLARGGGAIVNMASILGSAGFPNSPAYVAAKHDVVGLSKAAALEYATQGIRVTAVGPGFISTPRLSGSLASDEASFVTGSYHLVDGGYTAR